MRPVAERAAPGDRQGGRAGRSATAGYREALRRRRAARLRCLCALALAVALLWAGTEWSGSARHVALACAAVAAAAAGVLRPRPDPERWLRGAAGEEATARLLDTLPASRWAVMHDLAVPGSRSNIDHLLIGPTGVWVIDTKTRRGAVHRRLRTLRFGGRPLDTGPLDFEARVVSDRLGVRVRPLVAVHGAALPRRGVRRRGVRVCSAERVVTVVKRRGWALPGRRLGRREVDSLFRLAESTFRQAGCSDRDRRW